MVGTIWLAFGVAIYLVQRRRGSRSGAAQK
jgi:hypothetical protein